MTTAAMTMTMNKTEQEREFSRAYYLQLNCELLNAGLCKRQIVGP